MSIDRSFPNLRKSKKIPVQISSFLILSDIVINDEQIECNITLRFDKLVGQLDDKFDEVIVVEFEGFIWSIRR